MPFISVIIPVYNAQEFLPGKRRNERSTQHSPEGCARRVHHVHGQ